MVANEPGDQTYNAGGLQRLPVRSDMATRDLEAQKGQVTTRRHPGVRRSFNELSLGGSAFSTL